MKEPIKSPFIVQPEEAKPRKMPTRPSDMRLPLAKDKYVSIWREPDHVLCVLPLKEPGVQILCAFEEKSSDSIQIIMFRKWNDIKDAILQALVHSYGA